MHRRIRVGLGGWAGGVEVGRIAAKPASMSSTVVRIRLGGSIPARAGSRPGAGGEQTA